ncbi:MAG: response regulator [Aggregatilineales bacterium]
MSTWMVVEDEPAIYAVLLSMFELWGIDGIAFVDGESAVNWIDGVDAGLFKGELPELALIDIRLSGKLDGTDVGARLCASPALNEISIVLITAYRLSPEQEREHLARSGAVKVINKPLPSINELEEEFTNILKARAALRKTPTSTTATSPPVPTATNSKLAQKPNIPRKRMTHMYKRRSSTKKEG